METLQFVKVKEVIVDSPEIPCNTLTIGQRERKLIPKGQYVRKIFHYTSMTYLWVVQHLRVAVVGMSLFHLIFQSW